MKTLRRLGLHGLLLAAALALASCGGSRGAGQGADTQRTDDGAAAGASTRASEQAARQLVAPNGEYSDAAFVDAMIPHHEGAIEMARIALRDGEHQEIKTLARQIVDAQQAEVEKLGEVRDGLAPSGTTMQMSQEEMEGKMGMSEDPQALAEKRPFDRAFIDAMTPHHESAIAMAKVALEESENQEIRGIAEDIVSGQERELSQMKEWREEWYPRG